MNKVATSTADSGVDKVAAVGIGVDEIQNLLLILMSVKVVI